MAKQPKAPVEENASVVPEVSELKPVQPVDKSDKMDLLLRAVSNLAGTVESLTDRMAKMEGRPTQEHKKEARPEDISKAAQTKEGIDPRIIKIVEETLGEDFQIDIEPNKDTPGFLFTVIVPERLSDLKKSTRPVHDQVQGGYERDPRTGREILEEYYPQDRRSRSIASTQSFDAIREHCERIRGYIVGHYQRTKRPLPEFRLK